MSTLLDKAEEIIMIMTNCKEEAIKVDRGNAAAGKRLRAAIKEIPGIIKEMKKQSLGKE